MSTHTRTLNDHANLVLACLHQHRLLNTTQLHTLSNPDHGLRATQALLANLATRGLIASVSERDVRRGRECVWHLTATGASVTQSVPNTAEPRRRPITAEIAAGPLQRHTIAVNDACIAFVKAARQRGDECGPLSWRHEIAHRINTNRMDVVITDAVLRYHPANDDGAVFTDLRFIELDRTTIPVDRVAAKLARYAAFANYTPPGATRSAWKEQYAALPAVLLVLADASPARLRLRREHVLSLSRNTPGLGRDPKIHVLICELTELMKQGPYEPIFTRIHEPDTPCDWLQQEVTA